MKRQWMGTQTLAPRHLDRGGTPFSRVRFSPLGLLQCGVLSKTPVRQSVVRAFFQLYQSFFAKLRPSDSGAKTAALRRDLAHAFSPVAVKRLPNREFSRRASASLYLESGDLHFGSGVRVWVCARSIKRTELLLPCKIKWENTGNNFDMGPHPWLADTNILGFTRTYRLLCIAEPLQLTGNEIRDNRETLSNNRENRTPLSLHFSRY